ncbi:adenylyl-sulfate kinase [Alkalibacillus haloalkaliphilus]|uniref:adenylyl-sulfate kinase n=1 Tax=Alkalibacillus haloalkaliphilus TaxID=94136 RepID=UPI00031E9FEB|nr:adenylyl-sulfate kinase [Alkalibacillus haloalkaliphilus]
MNNNLNWQQHAIKPIDRERLMGHKSLVIWLTGLSASGKSTIGNSVEKQLYQKGIHSYLLDGDDIRQGLNQDLGFSEHDRSENIRRIAEVANTLRQSGLVTIVSTISPFKNNRELARDIISEQYFHEVYVSCALKVCEQRDPKGLYYKARSGQIPQFTGVNQPYETPHNPNLTLPTDTLSIEQASLTLVHYIVSKVKEART